MLSNEYKLNVLKEVSRYYPDASVELDYETEYQLLVAVMLSAQTTDKNVNKVTKVLFKKYPTAKDMKNIDKDELLSILKTLGLAKTKRNNLLKLSKIYDEELNNIMPKSRKELTKLPGVGVKTASAVLANIYGMQYIAVDTHINRICERLKIVKEGNAPEKTMQTLERILKDEDLNKYHHSLLFFGRYHCLARNPKCYECTLIDKCRYTGRYEIKNKYKLEKK